MANPAENNVKNESPAQENKMGVMPVGKLLFTMSLPIMISMLVQALYNVVDSMFVARVSENALTALSMAFPIQNLMIAVSTGTGVGINALLSRSLGARDYENANRAATNGLFVMMLSSIPFILFGLFGAKLRLKRFILFSALLCIAAYLCIGLAPIPALGLLGCAVCGFAVGIFWPGTLSMASESIPGGGTAMFALMALAGDIGCSGGPTLAGMVAGAFGDNLHIGILSAIVFPILMLGGALALKRRKQK